MRWAAGLVGLTLIVFGAIPIGMVALLAVAVTPAVAEQIRLDPCSAYLAGDPAAASRFTGFELPRWGSPRHQSRHSPAQTVPVQVKALYRAAAERYRLPWELLAGIGMAETRHGRHNTTSPAGAQGLMQFMPATFAYYGVDGDGDGKPDIHSDADSVFSAANYLVASGVRTGRSGVIRALWAYNHSVTYRNDVLFYAWAYAGAGPVIVAGETPADCLPEDDQPIPAAPADCPPSGSAAENGLRPAARYGLRCVKAAFPQITRMGGKGSRPLPSSDHPRGLAVDFMIPRWSTEAGNRFGWRVARWIQAHAGKLRVKYIIFDARKWNPAVSTTWRSYTHPSGSRNPTQAHRDHVHVSFKG